MRVEGSAMSGSARVYRGPPRLSSRAIPDGFEFGHRDTYPRRMGNTWGRLFRVTTWGESHGGATGAVVDGCPPRLPLSEAAIQPDPDPRAPGQSALVSHGKKPATV